MDQVPAADERRIVLVGKTGVGKSHTANTILGGEVVFEVGHGANFKTTNCVRGGTIMNGKNMIIVDTPGFFGTDSTHEEDLRSEISTCITKCSPGVHTFLIVLRVERYTPQEAKIVEKITDTFTEEAFKYAVVLFTHGDQLTVGQTIDSFVKTNKELDKLVQKCGGRCHVIDNKYWDKEHSYRSNKVQVEELMNTIEEMVRKNGGNLYTNAMLQTVEAAIKEKVEAIKKESMSGMTEREIRQRAEEEVSWQIKAAGLATGVLLGALLGIPVAIAAAVLVFGKVCISLYNKIERQEVSPGTPATVVKSIAKTSGIIGIGGAGTAGAVAEGTFATAGVACAAVGAGIMVAGGAAVGGYVGYQAAKKAKSPGDAAEKACEAVVDKALNMIEGKKKTH